MEKYGFLFEAAIFGAAAIGWGVWQLWSLKRDSAKSKPAPTASEKTPGHPEG